MTLHWSLIVSRNRKLSASSPDVVDYGRGRGSTATETLHLKTPVGYLPRHVPGSPHSAATDGKPTKFMTAGAPGGSVTPGASGCRAVPVSLRSA